MARLLRAVVKANDRDSDSGAVQDPRFVVPCREDVATCLDPVEDTTTCTASDTVSCQQSSSFSSSIGDPCTSLLEEIAHEVRHTRQSVLKHTEKVESVYVSEFRP